MSIKVSLNHQISYQFERPVILGPQTIGLRPAPHCRTPILSYALNISPSDYQLTWLQDHYGNFLAKVNFPQTTDYLKIEVDLIAQIQPINPFNFLIESYATHYHFEYEPRLAKELSPFLEIAESGELLKNWVEIHRQQDIYTSNFLLDLIQKLAQDIQYQIRLEPGIQTCEETLEKKIGSCRDTGWLLVQILRHYGLAARFVSGYLIQLTNDIPPLDGLPGPVYDNADLHAWAEVYIPGAGWIGLDPTSGLITAEGHIPLVCVADPQDASPVQGTFEPCESKLDFSVTVSRYHEIPRVTKPYNQEQWQQINYLGEIVEDNLQRLNVGLTMGGEPTFVSIDDFESSQWRVTALGEEKRKIAWQLLNRLEAKFAHKGGLLHYGLGKSYPGEALPRWTLGCYWRTDGIPLWHNRELYAQEDKNNNYTSKNAQIFIESLAKNLGVKSDFIISAYELNSNIISGYTLPILSVKKAENIHWSSCQWRLSTPNKIELLTGNLPIGFRLPLSSLDWQNDQLEPEAIIPLTHSPIIPNFEPLESPINSIRVALSVEVRQGKIHVFLPPISSPRSFVDLITAIENTTAQLQYSVLIEGYTPPVNTGIIGFQITPDPGVIEVNIHPASNWQELVEITNILYEEARLSRLGTEKYLLDGRRIPTGGGAHVTIGGKTVYDSPLLRRPDLLRSLITYWQNHPCLSFLFCDLFVGPTSQAPRVDEARHESLYELEIAFQQLEYQANIAPKLVDRLLRNLLVDITGNTHRSAFCVDKLYPIENPKNQLGLLEFRAFAMPPHPQMNLLQMLLIRALVAWFWEKPYTHSLIRWGTTLHDRFMLPHYLGEDLKTIIEDLKTVGYEFEFDWFAPFIEFRFPRYGEITKEGVELELRHGIEPWHVLGEESSSGSTARYVDSSMERVQIILRNALGNSANIDSYSARYIVTCQGRPIPLKSTGNPGEYVGAVRFRARRYTSLLHPAIDPHDPLIFDIVDTESNRSIGGCTYFVSPPNGKIYQQFPINHREAESRMLERFVAMGHTSGLIKVAHLKLNPEYPLTLDLRQIP
ncbi:MAG: transglutaminase family protein [Planktothrix agardhii KL2]|uniref:transglutaminase family protein n=1 Tax=Planktothrix agardhii TaxID=1160 RepID=UPI001A2C1D33|nr:transglutaminase family protein [Planktothrix agardhii]MBG0746933.1 transglutaminase family protein [Planktothrix agardhii KL2]